MSLTGFSVDAVAQVAHERCGLLNVIHERGQHNQGPDGYSRWSEPLVPCPKPGFLFPLASRHLPAGAHARCMPAGKRPRQRAACPFSQCRLMHFVTEKTLLKQVQQAKHPMARRFQWVGHRRPIPLGTPVAIQSLPAMWADTLIETNKKKCR